MPMPSPAMKSSTKKMLAGALLLAATLVVTGRKAQETPLTQPAQKTSETTSIGKLKQHSSSSPAIQPTDNNLEMSPEPRRYSSLEDVKNEVQKGCSWLIVERSSPGALKLVD